MNRGPIRQGGLSLTEILVTLAMVGILAGLAYPTYRDQVIKGRRIDAKQSLERLSQQLERCYTRYRRYDTLDCELVSEGPTVSAPSVDGYYSLASTDPNGNETLAVDSYSLFATPSDQRQGADTLCATFRLDHTNSRRAFDSDRADTTDQCW